MDLYVNIYIYIIIGKLWAKQTPRKNSLHNSETRRLKEQVCRSTANISIRPSFIKIRCVYMRWGTSSYEYCHLFITDVHETQEHIFLVPLSNHAEKRVFLSSVTSWKEKRKKKNSFNCNRRSAICFLETKSFIGTTGEVKIRRIFRKSKSLLADI